MEQEQPNSRSTRKVWAVIAGIAVASFVVGVAVGPKDDTAESAVPTTELATTTEAPTTTEQATTTTQSVRDYTALWIDEYRVDLGYFAGESARIMGDVGDAAGMSDLAGVVLACSQGMALTEDFMGRELYGSAPSVFRNALREYDLAYRLCVDFDLTGSSQAMDRGTSYLEQLTDMIP